MISTMLSGQVVLKNSSSADIRVSSINGAAFAEVESGKSATIPFLSETSGITKAKIEHYTYAPVAGFQWVNDGAILFAVVNGVATFSSPKQRQPNIATINQNVGNGLGTAVVVNQSAGKISTEKSSMVKAVVVTPPAPKWFSTATFVVKNETGRTITGYSEPFLGLCLATGKSTKKTITCPTGNIQAAFSCDDPDKTATGRNRTWAVLDKAIVEGCDTLIIYGQNLLAANTGVLKSKRFVNKTNLSYLKVNGGVTATTNSPATPAATTSSPTVSNSTPATTPVVTISQNSSQRLNFNLGWNVMALQYKDENGYPKQAVLLFLVTEGQKNIYLTQKSGKNNSLSEKDLEIK